MSKYVLLLMAHKLQMHLPCRIVNFQSRNMRSALRCAIFSWSCRDSGWRLRNSTAVTFDLYGQSTENSTFCTPSAVTAQRKAGAEKLPLNVTTIFSVRYCAGVLQAASRGREPRLVVDAVEHEGKALAKMPQDECQLGRRVEHAGKDETRKKMCTGLNPETPGGKRESS